MAIPELKKILSPPETPAESSGTWSDVEKSLGTKLPGDFVEFIQVYGTGMVSDFFIILNPFSLKKHLNLIEKLREFEQQQREIQEWEDQELADEVLLKLFPKRDGLLPWGYTSSGDNLFWKTTGTPDKWRVCVCEARGPYLAEFDMNMTSFLYQITAGKLVCPLFGEPFDGAWFTAI